FQYPLRVEMDWNVGVVAGFGAGSAVSVPSAGRNGLEPSRDTSAISLRPAFQYPLRVEMDWNPEFFWTSPNRLDAVSVPSAGRNGLELPDEAAGAAGVWGFSTLCGSKWIGTIIDLVNERGYIAFQYPLRVEMDWNITCCWLPL